MEVGVNSILLFRFSDPEKWSAAAMYAATRIFTSNLTEKMAQVFSFCLNVIGFVTIKILKWIFRGSLIWCSYREFEMISLNTKN